MTLGGSCRDGVDGRSEGRSEQWLMLKLGKGNIRLEMETDDQDVARQQEEADNPGFGTVEVEYCSVGVFGGVGSCSGQADGSAKGCRSWCTFLPPNQNRRAQESRQGQGKLGTLAGNNGGVQASQFMHNARCCSSVRVNTRKGIPVATEVSSKGRCFPRIRCS